MSGTKMSGYSHKFCLLTINILVFTTVYGLGGKEFIARIDDDGMIILDTNKICDYLKFTKSGDSIAEGGSECKSEMSVNEGQIKIRGNNFCKCAGYNSEPTAWKNRTGDPKKSVTEKGNKFENGTFSGNDSGKDLSDTENMGGIKNNNNTNTHENLDSEDKQKAGSELNKQNDKIDPAKSTGTQEPGVNNLNDSISKINETYYTGNSLNNTTENTHNNVSNLGHNMSDPGQNITGDPKKSVAEKGNKFENGTFPGNNSGKDLSDTEKIKENNNNNNNTNTHENLDSEDKQKAGSEVNKQNDTIDLAKSTATQKPVVNNSNDSISKINETDYTGTSLNNITENTYNNVSNLGYNMSDPGQNITGDRKKAVTEEGNKFENGTFSGNNSGKDLSDTEYIKENKNNNNTNTHENLDSEDKQKAGSEVNKQNDTIDLAKSTATQKPVVNNSNDSISKINETDYTGNSLNNTTENTHDNVSNLGHNMSDPGQNITGDPKKAVTEEGNKYENGTFPGNDSSKDLSDTENIKENKNNNNTNTHENLDSEDKQKAGSEVNKQNHTIDLAKSTATQKPVVNNSNDSISKINETDYTGTSLNNITENTYNNVSNLGYNMSDPGQNITGDPKKAVTEEGNKFENGTFSGNNSGKDLSDTEYIKENKNNNNTNTHENLDSEDKQKAGSEVNKQNDTIDLAKSTATQKPVVNNSNDSISKINETDYTGNSLNNTTENTHNNVSNLGHNMSDPGQNITGDPKKAVTEEGNKYENGTFPGNDSSKDLSDTENMKGIKNNNNTNTHENLDSEDKQKADSEVNKQNDKIYPAKSTIAKAAIARDSNTHVAIFIGMAILAIILAILFLFNYMYYKRNRRGSYVLASSGDNELLPVS